MLTFDELWQRLNHQDEGVEIEAKRGTEMGDSVLESISAFSNEPHRNGGYLLFGALPKPNTLFPEYELVGVPNPDKLQNDLVSRCNNEFNHPVRPQIWVERKGDRNAVVCYIPEAPVQQKPVYIAKRGQKGGAYRRIGSADVLCSEEDIAYFYQEQTHQTFDATVIRESALDDLDPEMLDEYRRIRAAANPNAAELAYSNEELVYALNAASRVDGRVAATLAGLLTFGTRAAIRRFFPSLRVDYIRVPGREWVPDPANRYETVEILDPLLRTIPRAINQVLDDLPKAFRLPAGEDRRQEVPLIPRDAIREVVVNALMHRNYRARGAVQIIRYSNRLEIRNPGISLVPDDRLGEPGSVTRNEKIAAILHETQYAETKGTGIRAVRALMDQHGLAPPFFESDREKDTFTVYFLFHHLLSPADLTWLGHFRDLGLSEDEQRALVFVREVGAINNAAYRDINRVETLIASGHLRRLRDLGLLQQKGQGRATYYVPTKRLGEPSELGSESSELEAKPSQLPTKPSQLPTKPSEPSIEPSESVTAEPSPLAVEFADIPEHLLGLVRGMRARATEEELRSLILLLCQVRPMRAGELSRLLARNSDYLKTSYLHPMVEEGSLQYVYPDRPTHPMQAYRTVESGQILEPRKSR